jgi:hypothetical protein
MAKRSLRKRMGIRRSKKMHGGQSSVALNAGDVSPISVDSANGYVFSQYGNGDTQWNNVFGPNSTSTMGNEIVNLNHPQQTAANLYPMKGGRRRRMKRGGQLLSPASVTPLALLAMQQAYGRRSSSKFRPRRRGSRRTRRR